MKLSIKSTIAAMLLSLCLMACSATVHPDGSITLTKSEAADYLESKAAAAKALSYLEKMAEAVAKAEAERDQALRQLFMLNELERKARAMCS